MGITVIGGTSGTLQDVDTTPKAARVILYDASGNVIPIASNSIAHDGAASAVNPVLTGGYANAAAPADVSADLDAVRAWYLRNGAQAIQPTLGGVLATTGNGGVGTGVQRVAIASDNTPWTSQGGKTNNNAAPGATNVGALTVLANAAAPSWTEGNEVLASSDLAGNIRTLSKLLGKDGISVGAVKAASTAALSTDEALVVAISPNNSAFMVGTKTNNNAVPGATNVGSLGGIANAAPPAWTEGNLVLHSTDLAGNVRAVSRPYAHGALGHYRTNHRCALVATQAAGSRLFVLRNNAANTIIVTRFFVQWTQNGGHTAILEDSLDLTRLTGFTVLDTTGTVTPTATVKRTSGMAAAPGGAQIRGVTVAGAAAGMTGGTSTLDATTIGQLPIIFQVALTTTTNAPFLSMDYFANDTIGMHPLALAQNEGIVLTNRVVFGATGTASVYIDCSWAEVAGF